MDGYNSIPVCGDLKMLLAKQGAERYLVTGPGVEPGLEDYEPSVQPYTTP